jgi:magnesium transporter
MRKVLKERAKKSGLPPGTPVFIGEKRTEAAKITVIEYDGTRLQESVLEDVSECIPYKDSTAVRWINIEGLSRPDVLEKISGCFGLHPLVMEDILNTDQRPKIEDYGEYIYVVLKMIHYQNAKSEIVTEQISLILWKNHIISFQEGIEGDVFNSVRERLRNEKSRMRKAGADYLAYSLLDAIVDTYFIILEKLGENIEVIEEELVSHPTPQTLQALHQLKREMIFLRRSVWPLREVISALERGESALIRDTTRTYIRDVYDHTIQVIDAIETYRDILSGMLDIYLSSISNRINEVMKILTIIATIFMPLTFLAGVYGMNFKYMPELEWHWGYPLVLLFMLMIGIIMMVFFRKKRWI